MTEMLTDERRYGNSEIKEWNDKNFKSRSRETVKGILKFNIGRQYWKTSGILKSGLLK